MSNILKRTGVNFKNKYDDELFYKIITNFKDNHPTTNYEEKDGSDEKEKITFQTFQQVVNTLSSLLQNPDFSDDDLHIGIVYVPDDSKIEITTCFTKDVLNHIVEYPKCFKADKLEIKCISSIYDINLFDTEEKQKIAIDANWKLLKYFHTQTPEICFLALKKNIQAFDFILDENKTEDMFILKLFYGKNDFQQIPSSFKTKKICDLVVQIDGNQLLYVPENMITKNMIETIFNKKNKVTFLNIPEKFKQYTTLSGVEVIQEIKNEVFKIVPDKWKSKTICDAAYSFDPGSFVYFPEKIKTSQYCEFALSTCQRCKNCTKTHAIFKSIPEQHKTLSMCYAFLDICGLTLEDVPEKWKTKKDLIERAIQRNALSLAFVPKDEITESMCLNAISNNIEAFSYVPETLKSKKIWQKMVQFDSSILQSLTPNFANEICFDIVSKRMLPLTSPYNYTLSSSLKHRQCSDTRDSEREYW